jgi:hypothetical protein
MIKLDTIQNPFLTWDGTQEWYNQNNQLHSFNDEPALIKKNGEKWWYKNGVVHRDNDMPAIEYVKNIVEKNNKNLNQIEYKTTVKNWYINGWLHRDNDKPAIEFEIEWTDKTNKREWQWFIHGLRHRDNDAAVIHSDGKKEYWLNGFSITSNLFFLNQRLKNELSIKAGLLKTFKL